MEPLDFAFSHILIDSLDKIFSICLKMKEEKGIKVDSLK